MYDSNGVWSTGNVSELSNIMADDHNQVDIVWSPDNTGGGRERMQKGIAAYRSMCAELTFTVRTVLPDETHQRCVVEWQAQGISNAGGKGDADAEGAQFSFGGVSILEVNSSGQISESRVYRGAPEGERAMFEQVVQVDTMEP